MTRRLMATVALALPLLAALTAGAEPTPWHPRLVRGELDNGLRYMVMRHENPPQRVSMWMHVHSGSLNETDEQRGLAHYLEHMAFNGSEHFDKNEVVGYFESLGLTFGRHQNAFTSFDQTTYMIDLHQSDDTTLADRLDEGLRFFSDVAFRLTLDPEQIDLERGVIMEELRTGLGPDRRVFDHILERIAPGSLIGVRLPIGTEERVMAMQRRHFKDYYETWYVPSNITLAVVGDLPEHLVVEKLTAWFGDAPAAPRPEPQDAGVRPYTSPFAIVATDDELRRGSVSVTRLTEVSPPATTTEIYRELIIDRLVSLAFNRRMAKKTREGELRSLALNLGVSDIFNAFRQISVNATGDPAKWEAMLEDVVTEFRRAGLHGFGPREMEDVRTEVVAAAELAVERAPTRSSRAILGSINATIGAGQPFWSEQQELDMLRAALDTITLDDVNRRVADLLDPTAVAFVASLPATITTATGDPATVPTEDELLALGLELMTVEPGTESGEARVTTVLDEPPAAGAEVADARRVHEGSGVTSVLFDNNVRLHHRFMDDKKDEVTITVSLAGGALLEDAETFGLTDVSSLALVRPAARSRTSTQIEDLMVGRKVAVGGTAGEDIVLLTITGHPDDLEHGMRLAYLLLTEPVIEEAVFDQWRQGQRQYIQQRKALPMGVASERMMAMLAPEGDPRFRPIELEDLDRITLADAQAWLDRLTRESPIEVSVVGDIPLDNPNPASGAPAVNAFDLVARYVGSLPERDVATAATHEDRRVVARPVGPLTGSFELETRTPQAIVQVGSFGVDWSDTRERRLLGMATQILSSRMIKSLREDQQLVYSIRASSVPGMAFPGYGMVVAGAPTEPAKAERLRDAIDEEFRRFADEGPTADEVETAKGQIENQLDEQMREPGFWTFMLSNLELRGTSLDEVMSAREQYATFEAADLQEAFARYYTPSGRFSLIVKPRTPEAPSGG